MKAIEFLQAKFPMWNLQERGQFNTVSLREENLIEAMEEFALLKNEEWFSVEDRPLILVEMGTKNWVATEDGEHDFIAAVPYNDSKHPDGTQWWIRHCVIEDDRGLCVVGDDDNESAGWTIEDVTHWKLFPSEKELSIVE